MKVNVTGLAHIGVPCSNLEDSISFYQGLGFRIQAKKENLNRYHTALLKNGDCTIELYEALTDEVPSAAGRTDGRIDHISLRCEGITELFDACKREGYRLATSGIETTMILEPLICEYFYILGPDQERIELMEIKWLNEKVSAIKK